MASALRDRVMQLTTSTGTGPIVLGAVAAGMRSFATLGDGGATVVCIEAVDEGGAPTGAFEICETIYTASGATLSRGRVRASSTGARVNFAAGTKNVFIVQDAATAQSDAYNAKAYGLVGDGVTDDTAALQGLINLVSANGGGEIRFGPGVYLIGGPLQDPGNGNAQILLPTVALDQPMISITLRGPLAPPKQYFTWSSLPRKPYATIKSTLGGATGTASLIGGPSSSAIFPDQNNVTVNVQDLIFELPPDPTLSALSLQWQQACRITDVLVHCGNLSLHTIIQPTHPNAYGVKLPEESHSAFIPVDGLNVFGVYWGLRDGELTSGRGVRVWSCYKAVDLPFTHHPSVYLDLGVYWMPYGLVATGGGNPAFDGKKRLTVVLLDLEHANGQGAPWQDTVADIDDPNDRLEGFIQFKVVKSAVGAVGPSNFIVNGGRRLGYADMDWQAPPMPVSCEIGTVASDTVVVVFSREVKAADYASGVTITVNGEPATITSAMRYGSTKTSVSFVLSAPVQGGDSVTWAYAAIDGFLTNDRGSHLIDVPAMPVVNHAVGGLTLLVRDDFTAPDGTSLPTHSIAPVNIPATAWHALEGALQVTGNRVVNVVDGTNSGWCDPGVANGTIRLVVRRPSTDGIADIAILFRAVGADNYWVADLQVAGTDITGTFSIYRKESGTYTEVQHTPQTFAPDTDYLITVVLNGPAITATVDGQATLSTTSNFNQTSSVHGIWITAAVGEHAYGDVFQVLT